MLILIVSASIVVSGDLLRAMMVSASPGALGHSRSSCSPTAASSPIFSRKDGAWRSEIGAGNEAKGNCDIVGFTAADEIVKLATESAASITDQKHGASERKLIQ